MKRQIRRSEYGDYFAIDYLNEKNEIVETPLYLKKGESARVKIRWEWKAFNGNGSFDQSEMILGMIRFDGANVHCSYDPDKLMGSKERDWWEPTKYELESPSIIHFRLTEPNA